MKKIDRRMQAVLNRREKILVSGVPVGYPDLDATRRNVETYIRSGIDVVEFSMPSMNPYIDTKIIADSNVEALHRQSDLYQHFATLEMIRKDYPDEPFYMMAYADIISQFGVERFVETIKDLEIDGLELPDHNEEFPELVSLLDPLLENAGIYRIYILHHPFKDSYLQSIREKARGFMLLQSVADETGRRPKVAPENKENIEKIKNTGLDFPVILGYGINKPERVKEAAAVGADGVIVGTAMIEKINAGVPGELAKFIRSLKDATLP